MSTEDDLEEVYHLLSRSFSEDERQRQRMQQIQDFEETRRPENKEDLAIREAVEKQQAHEQLKSDLNFATSWVISLEYQRRKSQGLGGHEIKGARVGNDADQLPATGTGTKLESCLEKWRINEGDENKQCNRLQDSTDMEWVMAASVVQRTASLLQADAYRLLRVISYLTSQNCELQQADIMWMAPYLEAHLRLVRGDYDKLMYGENQEDDVEEPGLGLMPTCHHANEQMPLELNTTDHREQTGKHSVQFDMLDFAAPRQKDAANISFRQPKDEGSDDQSPHRKYNGESIELQVQRIERNSELHEHIVSDSDSQGLGPVEQVEAATAPQNYGQQVQLGFNAIGHARRMVDWLEKGKTALETGLAEALEVGDRLMKSNVSLEENFVHVLSRLDSETKWHKVAEKQIHILSLELHQERTVTQRIINQREVFTSHVRVNREFKATRDSLKGQLDKAQSRLADEVADEARDQEQQLKGAIEVEMLQAAIDDLESEREQAWLEFVESINSIVADEMAQTDARGRTKTKPEQTTRGDICLYCDTEYCPGCSGWDCEE